MGCALVGAALVAMPLLLDYGPNGTMVAVWWNHLLTGIAVIGLSLVGIIAIAFPSYSRGHTRREE